MTFGWALWLEFAAPFYMLVDEVQDLPATTQTIHGQMSGDILSQLGHTPSPMEVAKGLLQVRVAVGFTAVRFGYNW